MISFRVDNPFSLSLRPSDIDCVCTKLTISQSCHKDCVHSLGQ